MQAKHENRLRANELQEEKKTASFRVAGAPGMANACPYLETVHTWG